jgi:hypothetical protein
VRNLRKILDIHDGKIPRELRQFRQFLYMLSHFAQESRRAPYVALLFIVDLCTNYLDSIPYTDTTPPYQCYLKLLE